MPYLHTNPIEPAQGPVLESSEQMLGNPKLSLRVVGACSMLLKSCHVAMSMFLRLLVCVCVFVFFMCTRSRYIRGPSGLCRPLAKFSLFAISLLQLPEDLGALE